MTSVTGVPSGPQPLTHAHWLFPRVRVSLGVSPPGHFPDQPVCLAGGGGQCSTGGGLRARLDGTCAGDSLQQAGVGVRNTGTPGVCIGWFAPRGEVDRALFSGHPAPHSSGVDVPSPARPGAPPASAPASAAL